MENVGSAVDVAKGISDFGMLAMTAAFFLVLSGLLMVACFRWFQKIVNGMIESDAKKMDSLIAKTETQNDLLNDIADGLRPSTRLQIEAISNTTFDLAVEKVCRIIKKVKEENNIVNKEATKIKIKTLLYNLHYDRNSRFDTIKYRGRSLASYTNPEWVDWVSTVVESEVYAESQNNGRAYTNVSAVYDRIKLDLYKRMYQ